MKNPPPFNLQYFPRTVLASSQIVVRFSAPVAVTGAPALKLETGVFDREAVWVNTTDFNSSAAQDGVVAAEVDNDDYLLLFEYVVVTGDSAGDLDYWADDEARQQTSKDTLNMSNTEVFYAFQRTVADQQEFTKKERRLSKKVPTSRRGRENLRAQQS